ncbi:41349_t:CDS:10, partial [Gigaspora margarita]
LVRVRSKQGTIRFEVDPNDDISALGTKIADHLNLTDYSSIGISDKPTTASTPIKDLVGKSIGQLGIGHGELLFITYQETVASDSSQTNNVGTKASMPFDIKQDPIDDFLEKQDGLIKRGRDSKFCKHAANGMCDYCMPLEPYDINYLTENKIKHMSFHAYLRKINKQNKHSSKFIPPLEEPDLRVKTNCSGTHAPWPEGICTKCQPSAVTLQLQQYRMVDHVEFSVPSLIDNFIHFWRSTGTQRFGYLYGRYEHYPDVPLGVKAVVEAIYEPPQEDEVDGLTLILPWNEEKLIDEVAMNCGLQKVGMIYTDLTDDGSGLGKNKHPTASKWSASGKFNSRFVTCVVTGNSNGDIDVSAYQVSNICTSMVAEDIIEASVDPSVVRVKESTSDKYVPEVFYKYKNKYGVNVQKSAKPCFPVTHGFPSNPVPLFTSPISFPIENRPGIESQDLKGLYRHLGLEASGNVHVDYVSDFHLLTFVKGTGILDQNDFAALARLAVSHEEKDANQLAQST